MSAKKKKLPSKISKHITQRWYGRTPQEAGYLKPQEGIGSMEELVSNEPLTLLNLLNTNLPEHLRSFVRIVEHRNTGRAGRGYADFSIVDTKTGKSLTDIDIKTYSQQNKKIKDALEKTFGTFEKGLEAIKKYQPEDEVSKAFKKIRDTTEPLSVALKKFENKLKTTNFETGAVRKQRFKTDNVQPLVPQILGKPPVRLKEKLKTEKSKTEQLKFTDIRGRPTVITKLKGEKSPAGYLEYAYEHKLASPFDVIKYHGKYKKKFTINNWDDLIIMGETLNMRPQELFDYAIEKAQTKKRYLELSLYREIDRNNAQAFEEFIDIYRKHLKSKKPLKGFMFEDEYKKWSVKWDIYFKSEENLRSNIKIMVKTWNKKYPEDKIPEKLK